MVVLTISSLSFAAWRITGTTTLRIVDDLAAMERRL